MHTGSHAATAASGLPVADVPPSALFVMTRFVAGEIAIGPFATEMPATTTSTVLVPEDGTSVPELLAGDLFAGGLAVKGLLVTG